MEISKTAGSLKRPTSTPAFQERHGSLAEAKVPESKTDSVGAGEISPDELYKIYCIRHDAEMEQFEARSYFRPVLMKEEFVRSDTMQFAARCALNKSLFPYNFSIDPTSWYLVFSGQGVVADIHFNVTQNQEFEFWYNGANENKRIVEKTEFEAALNLYSQLIEAKKMLDPMLPTGLTIERSTTQPCLKFVVQLRQSVKQYRFRVNDGNLDFLDYNKSYSPHEAIQLISSRHDLDRASAPLIQESINTSLDLTGDRFFCVPNQLPLLNVQSNENVFHLVNQQIQEARPFDLIFNQNDQKWGLLINFNPLKIYRPASVTGPLLDEDWQHISHFIPVSSIPTFRSVCRCFAARKLNDRFIEAPKFRNANVISFLKSKLGSCVDILRTPNDRWPYSIQKSGHQNHPDDPTYQRFLFDFRKNEDGYLQLHLANALAKNGFKALSIVQFLNRIGVTASLGEEKL